MTQTAAMRSFGHLLTPAALAAACVLACALGGGVGQWFQTPAPASMEVSKRTPAKRKAIAFEPLADFYVSPDGSPDGAGTTDAPWDLATALRQPREVVPGSVIWLRGGTYGNSQTYFTSVLTGTPDHPVIVRQAPGERATVYGSLVVNGAYAWYWDFEVTSTQTDRTGDQRNPAAGTLDGIEVNGPFTKFINLVVHDTREGFGLWTPAEGAEVAGCLIYHNGWQGPDRGHGHGIYTQNQNAEKLIQDNIIFNQFGVGIHGYGSAKAFVQNYRVERNIVFNNGILATDGRTDNIFFGAGGPLSNITLDNNYTYHTPSANIGTSRIGWEYGGPNDGLTLIHNHFIGGYLALQVRNWNRAIADGNTVYSAQAANVYLQTDALSGYQWDHNRYAGAGQFFLAGQRLDWDGWRRSTRFDSLGDFKSGPPRGVWTFVEGNPYEPGRANVIVYNWDHADRIDVDLSTVLKEGSAFEIRDAQNYFAEAIVAGTYKGGTVSIGLAGLKVVPPLGDVPHPPEHTGPEFAAFVLLSR